MNDLSSSKNPDSPDTKAIISIIEDDLDHLKILEEYLKPKGFNIHSVKNPVSALNQIKKNNPDIILIELQMSQLRGERVIKVLRNNEINTPIIVLSGEINTDIIIAIRGLNVKGFFTKPVELKKLEEKIRSILYLKDNPKSRVADKPVSINKKKMPPTLLIITEYENIKDDPDTIIPRSIFEKQGFRIISMTSYQDSIEALKKPQNNIQVILVNASNEAMTMTMAKLINIIVLKNRIPVYFITNKFSPSLQDLLNSLGFVNLIPLQETSPNDIIAIFKPFFTKTHKGKRVITKQHQINIIRDLKVIKSLPPMPDIYRKIEKLARDPNSTSADYSKVLEFDTDITARLLRMSNSVYFSFKREIKSVKNAVTLMGIKEIISLVRLSCITGNLNVTPSAESAVKKVWEHSATCAIAAKLVYDKTKICKETLHEDSLFTGGIIHDIGKIVFWKFFSNIYSSFINNPEVGPHPSENDERKFIGISHCEVGKVLSEHWKLPESFTNVIAFHHKPMLKPESDLLKIIHISDIVSNLNMNIIGDNQELGNDPGLDKIGLTGEMIRELAKELEPAIKEKSDLVLQMITG